MQGVEEKAERFPVLPLFIACLQRRYIRRGQISDALYGTHWIVAIHGVISNLCLKDSLVWSNE